MTCFSGVHGHDSLVYRPLRLCELNQAILDFAAAVADNFPFALHATSSHRALVRQNLVSRWAWNGKILRLLAANFAPLNFAKLSSERGLDVKYLGPPTSHASLLCDGHV